jgi:cell wall-associated NlpC family hydrolase
MLYKRTLAALLVNMVLFSSVQITYAAEIDTTELVITEENIESAIIDVEDTSVQIDELYEKVSENVGINKEFIQILHSLAGGKAVYADKKPNIYKEETITTLESPMNISGANTEYRKAEFIECDDDKIERPSEYYLPDAVYSVSYDIYSIMTQRYYKNRGGVQEYFDALTDEAKQRIIFDEAVLIYTGEDEEVVDNFFKTYEKILYDKQNNENVIEKNESGQYIIKDKFLDIITDIGITDETRLNNLAIILSYDKDLAINDSIENIKDTYTTPYKLNYTSRENMMIAAMCLVGKVRYTWGGGHSGASNIDGISPVWELWNNLYDTEDGIGNCIKPSGSWCPVHGYNDIDCTFQIGETIYSLDEYIENRVDLLETDEIKSDKYRELLEKVDYTDGISIHTLDGLDCSGYASWLYNQITDKYEINSVAMSFVNQEGVKEIEFGSEMLPGDIVAWNDHMVVIIGKVANKSKAYVTVEQTTNVLKFGVIYYKGVKASDFTLAKEIATEANKLIGGIDTEQEEIHIYCMDNIGKYSEDVVDENGEVIETVEKEYKAIGRFSQQFIDQGIKVGEVNLPIEKMCAKDIIQYTLTKLPISYVKGYSLYEGDFFNKDEVASNLGVSIILK